MKIKLISNKHLLNRQVNCYKLKSMIEDHLQTIKQPKKSSISQDFKQLNN